MKKLLVLFVLLFTVLFTYTVIAQEMGLVRRGYEISLAEKVQSPLGPPLAAGTYTIGTGGNFPTIDSAFNKLRIDGIAGGVTLELIDNLYTAPQRQYGFSLYGPIPGAGPNSRVTIKPAQEKNVTIEGNGEAVFYFESTSFVTVDGVSLTGATTLAIHTLSNLAYYYNDGIDFVYDSDHNVMKNIIFVNEDYSRTGTSGFFTGFGAPTAPDSNIIENNYVKKSGLGIFVSGWGASVKAVGNIIRGNKIGSETDSLIGCGIQLSHNASALVENNIVQHVKQLGIEYNLIHGINIYYGNDCTIRNNIVHNIYASSTLQGCAGIILSGGSGEVGNNNSIYNNMIYDINCSSDSTWSSVDGIEMFGQNNPKIYYNSVYLHGSGNGSNPSGSDALGVWSNCTNVEAKNNIFVNTRNESPYSASAIYNSTIPNLTSDYNLLYYDPSQNSCLVRISSVKFSTLSAWQASGKDLHSVSEMPHFLGSDLHLDWSYAAMIDGHATPITGITTDIDGEPRNSLTPDIGADEGVIVPVEFTSFTASSINKEVTLIWSTATELNNYGFEIQRKAFDGDFATVAFIKGQGTTTKKNEYSFVDKNLDEGKYSYRLKQVDLDGKFEYSNTITVDVEVLSITSYSLEQNYPNPFNPITTISYALKEKGAVKLTFLDLLGEEIAVLVNEEQDKGYHKVELNAGNLSSGVYYYRLNAGDFIQTKKMLLLK